MIRQARPITWWAWYDPNRRIYHLAKNGRGTRWCSCKKPTIGELKDPNRNIHEWEFGEYKNPSPICEGSLGGRTETLRELGKSPFTQGWVEGVELFRNLDGTVTERKREEQHGEDTEVGKSANT